MKNTVIIGIVVIGVAAVVGLKVMKKSCGDSAQSSCCPCEMIDADSSTNIVENANVE